ncbi:MAG: thymidylate kinase, partial [Thermoproteota archaeon]
MRTICITGGDGTGKSTQCESLKIHITALGKSVIHASIWDALPILQAHLKSNATT